LSICNVGNFEVGGIHGGLHLRYDGTLRCKDTDGRGKTNQMKRARAVTMIRMDDDATSYQAISRREDVRAAGDKDDNEKGNDGDDGSRTGLVTKTRPKTKKPSLYKVLLLNDDYTPMEFVVLILQRYFSKSHDEAERIMLHVHQKGVGMCGVYTFEIAETKVTQVMDFSRANNHPLQCTMEKE
jgi:ATP-dependent Clp protease adaptor protein ClpS